MPNSSAIAKTGSALLMAAFLAGCGGGLGGELEVVDPICASDRAKDWIVENEPSLARQIISNNRLIGKTCEEG